MRIVRPSIPEDVPAQRELWRLAFGDGEDYIDNFYHTYYQPERVLVLEEEGVVRSMTAWFDRLCGPRTGGVPGGLPLRGGHPPGLPGTGAGRGAAGRGG